MNISYDKSIYFACRYLTSRQYGKLDKGGNMGSKTTPDKFFNEISSFNDMSTYSTILAEEKKLKRQIADAGSISERRELNGKYVAKKSARASTINTMTDNGISVRSKIGYRTPKAKIKPRKPRRR